MTKPDIISIDELLAMPDEQYMNVQQLAFFQHLLEQQLAHIHDNAAETGKHLREQQELPDPADRATQEELHTLELRTRDRERKLEKKIHAALQRIHDHAYGYCEESGEPIGLKRLLARPTATLSIDAQERHERRERQFSH